MIRCWPALAAVCALVTTGCSDDPPSPERVQACLSERGDVDGAEVISAGSSDVSSITPEQGTTIIAALQKSQQAVRFNSGGPAETSDGGVSDAPLRITELHFFPSAAEATAGEAIVAPAVGRPDESVFNGAQTLGTVLMLHYSVGPGDRPGGMTIERDLKPARDCLASSGY